MPTMLKVHCSKREYSEYLLSEHWRNLRGEILARHPTCERCAKRPAVQVHHLRYRNLVDVRHKDLLSVCDQCHGEIHRAVNFGLFDLADRRSTLTTTSIEIATELAHRSGAVVFEDATLERLNTAPISTQRRVCGIIKAIHPGDFTKWSGAKTTRHRMRHILFLLALPPTLRDLPLAQRISTRRERNRLRRENRKARRGKEALYAPHD